ncbi:MAG TPA: hypothetical protein VGR95_10320 [Thermoanaerobaculia bacterium]|jgi:hypothetical protein|nr:hypothetical protein [Thermoanaerobaculia bacterium]
MKQMITTNGPTTSAADTPQPAPMLTPDTVIEQVRTLRSQLPAVAALTSRERKNLRISRTNAEPIVQASLNVIGVSDNVSAALGQPIDAVRALQQDAILWKAAEEEVQNLLAGIAGANAIRRRKLAQLGAKAYVIGTQLANDPENEVLVSHVEEIRRMKRIARRKKAAPPTPGQPSPTPSTPAPSAPSVETKQ